MKLKTELPIYDWRETGRVMGFYRRSLNLTKSEVARLVGVVGSTVSFWERGIKEPKISHVVAVAHLFGLSEMDLLHPSEEVMKWVNMNVKDS